MHESETTKNENGGTDVTIKLGKVAEKEPKEIQDALTKIIKGIANREVTATLIHKTTGSHSSIKIGMSNVRAWAIAGADSLIEKVGGGRGDFFIVEHEEGIVRVSTLR